MLIMDKTPISRWGRNDVNQKSRRTMTVRLTREQEQRIEAIIHSGAYHH
jgi:hypothetical protein